MSFWKKALSTAASAALLASVFTAGTASAVTTVGTAYPYSFTTTSGTADGVSYIPLTFGASTAAHATVVSVTVSGGFFLNGTGAFAPAITGSYPRSSILLTNAVTVPVTAGDALWLAASTAGTATVSISYNDSVLGHTVADSVQSFTFTAASATTVSTSWSTTSLSASSAAAVAGDTGVVLTTSVKDSNNAFIAAGATVTWTLSGPAYFDPAGALSGKGSTVETASALGAPVSSDHVFSTGVAGAVTVTTTVTYLGVSYTLTAKTLTLVGPVSKIDVSNNVFSIATNNAAAGGELEVAVSDASGNPITGGAEALAFAVGTYTPANIFTVTIVPAAAAYDSVDKAYDFDVRCTSTTGTGTVTIKASTTIGTTTTTVTSAAITFTCADQLSASAVGTLDISASASSVAPNGNVNVLVTVKDKNGLPAPDGTVVTAVTNGVGTVVSTKGVLNTAKTSNGTAKFIYLAPANAGSATVTAFVANATPSSKAVTITIGSGGVSTGGANASALGITHSGPFSASTKVAHLGKYETFRMMLGASAAGKTVAILVAKKNSAGVWSAFTRLTSRVADSAGNVYFYWRSSSTAWVSVRGSLDTTMTNAVQGRWR